MNKGINARKRKVKVGRKTVTVKATPTKAEHQLQKNLTFQMEMSEGHQQELAEEVKSKKEAMRLLQKRLTQMRKERGIDEDSGAHAIDKAFAALKRELIARLASTILSLGRTSERCLSSGK